MRILLEVKTLCVLLMLMCVANSSIAQQDFFEGKTITWQGNDITFSEAHTDTVVILDPVTGEEITKFIRFPAEPLRLNTNKIYDVASVTQSPQSPIGEPTVAEYLLTRLMDNLNALPDGNYYIRLNNVVVNDTGKIVSYYLGGIIHASVYPTPKELDPNIKAIIDNRIEKLMQTAPKMLAATLDGKNVAAIADIDMARTPITVKNGETTIGYQ